MDWLHNFLAAPEATPFKPASVEELDAFQADTGLSLPEPIVRLYEASNRLNIDKVGLKFLPLEGVKKYIEGFQRLQVTERWGYFPFTDANDFNPYCVCCNEPLAGKIVHVFHDDSARLDFGGLETFVAAVLKLARSRDDPWIDNLPAQYDDVHNRTPEDLAVGMQLLTSANTMSKDDPDRNQMLEFGIRLLSDNYADQFAKLLDGSAWVRGAALERLRRIQTLESKEAIRKYDQTWHEFRTGAIASLRQAEIKVENVKNDCVLIQPGHTWLDLGFFYEDHKDPDIFERIVSRAIYFVSQKPP
jgi:hypothetical protein